jgi:hypothetical protein
MFEVIVNGVKVFECGTHAKAIAWMEANGLVAWVGGVELNWED